MLKTVVYAEPKPNSFSALPLTSPAPSFSPKTTFYWASLEMTSTYTRERMKQEVTTMKTIRLNPLGYKDIADCHHVSI